jgi:hypothetical protein
MHHTNEDHTANAKRSCVRFATRGIPDKESSAGGAVVLDASGSNCCKDRFLMQFDTKTHNRQRPTLSANSNVSPKKTKKIHCGPVGTLT